MVTQAAKAAEGERTDKLPQLNVTLSDAEIEEIDGYRDTRFRTRSAVIAEMIRFYRVHRQCTS